jgi:hypothetical protein
MKILTKRRAALAAAVATAAVAIGAPAATASEAPKPMQFGLPPSVTCPPWYGLYSIAGLGCLSWYQVWLQRFSAFPFRAEHVTP